MAIKDQLLKTLEVSRTRELELFSWLSDELRVAKGTYEDWSAKDFAAHTIYWEEVRSAQSNVFSRGEPLEPLPQFEEANAACYERFKQSTWEEIEAYAAQTHTKVLDIVREMSAEQLAGPSARSDDRKMWEEIVGAGYTHKLGHYTQFYQEHGEDEIAAKLWTEWADLVSPLDDRPEWQGNVHYNAACSLALTGDVEGALERLQTALELRPGLIAWSRKDSDLASLHGLPTYRDLVAPGFWWDALEASPLAEAVSDQFLRSLIMLREAVSSCPVDGWREGETPYLRPAALVLHIVQTIDFYSAAAPGEGSGDPRSQIHWQERDSSRLPDQESLLEYLGICEERVANLISSTDLLAVEGIFPWTGSTVLSRVLYTLRHTQHHLADLAMELERRGFPSPDWQ
jgi:hypothetical protein